MSEVWRDDFPAFLDHIGPCPHGYTLDRRDTNGHYEPGNVRWATYKQQGENRRDNHNLEAFGKRMHISDWAQHTGICHATIGDRLKRGWPVERALTTPVRKASH